MSDHLPECLNDDDTYGWRRWCICEELRACEQRVLDAARDAVAAALVKGLATSTDGALYFFELGGDPDFPNSGHEVTFRKDSLIAAIDALRTKP